MPRQAGPSPPKMFSSFRTGADTNDQGWDDTPVYVPGRFHAHPRPAPPGAPILASGAARTLGPRPRPQRRGVTRRAAFVDDCPPDGDAEHSERSWLLLRPGRDRVEGWLENWWRRWFVLVACPCLVVWTWCAIPFPVSDPYVEEPPWHLPWPGDPPNRLSTAGASSRPYGGLSASSIIFAEDVSQAIDLGDQGQIIERDALVAAVLPRGEGMLLELVARPIDSPEHHTIDLAAPLVTMPSDQLQLRITPSLEPHLSASNLSSLDKVPNPDPDLPVDANFYFFLIVYYGIYLGVALLFVTKLFDLYRLNWWPTSLGGSFSYLVFWSFSLLVGFLLHHFDLDGLGRNHSRGDRAGDNYDWERKTTWVGLAFATMALPAFASLAKLRADRRQTYRHSLTAAQKTFLDRQLASRMPRSYKRFLWFILALSISLVALITGQGFATIYLSTLPHSSFDSLVYVWSWILSVQVLNAASNWVLESKVRSKALAFVLKFYYFLLYFVFYRTLFARLRSPDQALYIQLLSSSWVAVWYPISISKTFHRLLVFAFGYDKTWEEHADSVASMLYLRNLAENVTMVAFLGWLTILHYGPNKALYPFFAFDDTAYTYRLTFVASAVIWVSELTFSFLARLVIWWWYKVDVTNVGLDEFREHPEAVIACVFTSAHVLMDVLLFLIKLNFR